MNETLDSDWMAAAQDERITDAVKQERARLRSFIRKRVPDRGDAEDILQDVFYELVEAYRLMKPIERVSAWLFRVARNRITDLFRKKRPDSLADVSGRGDDTGRSFKEMSAATGIGLNTLLSRKHYAILQLRERLQAIYDEFVKT